MFPDAMMNTYNVCQPVAHLSVSWNVIALPFSVVIVSNVIQYIIYCISQLYPSLLNRLYSYIFKHVHVILIVLMAAKDATIQYASAT